ncbi:MAG: peptidase C15 [Cyanobacteria bacterium J06626_4]
MTLLLTSFAPWKAHQRTNAADDLIALARARNQLPGQTLLMRHLPVHWQLASGQVLAALFKHRPAAVVCCGMAEKRAFLSLERYAHHRCDRLETALCLPDLCAEMQWTTVSDDAGNYVCNALYYQLLDCIQQSSLPTQCLFIHVPPISAHNRELLVHDFAQVLVRISHHQRQEYLTSA